MFHRMYPVGINSMYFLNCSIHSHKNKKNILHVVKGHSDLGHSDLHAKSFYCKKLNDLEYYYIFYNINYIVLYHFLRGCL